MRSTAMFLSIATLALLAPTHASADFTGPGRNSGYASTEGSFNFPSIPTPILVATIERGKRKSVLEIAASVQNNSGAAVFIGMLVQVNGVDVAPTNHDYGGFGQNCTASCVASGNWWLDLDAAETANPGKFIGKELQVVVTGYDAFGAGGQSYFATLSAKLQKK